MDRGVFVFRGILVVLLMSCATAQAIDFQGTRSCSPEEGYAEFCVTVQPKEWSPDEITFMESTLQKFREGGLKNFLIQIQQNGFHTFFRYQNGFSIDFVNNGYLPDNEVFAMTTLHDVVPNIAFTDYFFDYPVKVDPISGVDRRELTLLHEMAHAFDSANKISRSPQFLELAGFDDATPFNNYAKATTQELEILKDQTINLREKNDFVGSYALERKMGMKLGLPRLYSTTNPQEAFADLVAFIYLDPHATEYINPDLIQLIREKVFQAVPKKI